MSHIWLTEAECTIPWSTGSHCGLFLIISEGEFLSMWFGSYYNFLVEGSSSSSVQS